MNILIMATSAAGCASAANLCFRKGSSASETTYRYLFFYYLASFFGAFLVQPASLYESFSLTIFFIGCLAGALNVVLMTLIGKALTHTTASITYTFQNASSVFPNFLLFLFLGSSFGFIVTKFQVIGMFLILIGLFSSSFQKNTKIFESYDWLKYVIGCFIVQTLILCIMQGRCLAFENKETDNTDLSFMLGFFGMALAFQSILLLKHYWRNKESRNKESNEAPQNKIESKKGKKNEFVFGVLGGIMNAGSTYFLLKATQMANPIESGLIFPFFAVAVIILCTLWGYCLYQEKPNPLSIAFCSAGIVIASLDAIYKP